MSSPGATELLIVLVIVLLILGPKRLPSLGRQLGGGIREFRRSFGATSDSAEESGRVGNPAGGPGAPAVSTADARTPAAEADSERPSV